MKPAARKQAAKQMIENSSLSQRAACRLAGIRRSTYAYRARPRNDAMLRARLKRLAARHSSYGYLFLHALLKKDKLVVNTEAEYEALTLELARDASELNAIKAKLAKNRLSEPLFDTKRYTRHFESGLRQAYDRYFNGQEPEDIWIEESDSLD